MSKTSRRLIAAASFTLASTVALAPAAHAQATRTWVSGVGDDVNPCSRTAPCKTFQGTISKTAAGGEINCLDPGAWGAVTITKSITIDCSQFPGGVLVAGSNAITINAGVADNITLRGLEFTGVGSSLGLNGVRILQAGSVTIENVVIRYMGDYGVRMTPANVGARLHLINVSILNGGSAGPTGGGVLLQPNGGSVFATLKDTRIIGNQNIGLNIIPGDGSVLATVRDSTIANNSVSGISMTTTNAASAGRLFVRDSEILYNTTSGVSVTGNNLVAGISDSTITGNGTGVIASGVHTLLGIRTAGGNLVSGNTVDGTFTGTIAKQ